MSREEFRTIVERVADYLPDESTAIATWNKYKIMDSAAVVSRLHRTKEYRTHFLMVKPIISRSISDIPDGQLCKDIIALIDTYYPSIIAEISSSDNSGNRGPGDLLVSVIKKLVDEVRS